MNRLECKTVRDLLPLYMDGICSEESQKLVDEHLAQCSDCKKIFEQMNMPVEAPITADEGKSALQRIKKKIRKKYVILAVITALLAGLWTGLSIFMQLVETPMSYEEVKVSVVQDKKTPTKYNLTFSGPSYEGLYGEAELVAENEQYEYLAEVIHCTSSMWSRTFKRKPMKNEVTMTFSSDPEESVDGVTQFEDGREQKMRTVAAYYQATPGSPRYLLWVSDDFKDRVYRQIDEWNAVAGERIVKADQ